MRCPNEKLITKESNIIYHSQQHTRGQYGIGFLIKPEIKLYITEISAGTLKIKLEDRNTYVIIHVYAPTSVLEDKEIEEFYTKLGEL